MAKYSVSYIYEIVDKYSKSAKDISKNTQKIENAAKKAKAKVSNFSNSLKNMAKDALESKIGLAALGGALTLFMGSSFRTYLSFEKSMNRLSAITMETSENLELLSSKARKMGETTAFSASQSADAMVFLAQAGLSTNEILDAIGGTLQLASAGSLDLASAADIATNVLAQMGMEVSELTRVNDVLAKSQSTSNTDILQLAGAMNTSGQTAAAMGIEIELLAASLGTMANAGLKAENAGTLFRNMILQTAVGAKKHAKTYRNLGVNMNDFLDAQGRFKDFKGFIGAMEKVNKTGKLTIPTLNKLFGERGFRAMQVMIGSGVDGLSEFEKTLKKAKGTAKEMAERELAGISGALVEMRSAFEGLQNSFIGKFFSKISEVLVDMTSVVIRALTPNGEFSRSLIEVAKSAWLVIEPLGKAFGLFADVAAFPALMKFLEAISFLLKGIATIITVIVEGLKMIGALAGGAIAGLVTGDWGAVGRALTDQIKGAASDIGDIWSGGNVAAEGAINNRTTVDGSIGITANGATVDNASFNTPNGKLGTTVAMQGG